MSIFQQVHGSRLFMTACWLMAAGCAQAQAAAVASVPGTQAAFGDLVKAWADSGGHCPE